MNKIIIAVMVILLVCSCSRLGMYKENDFGYMMNDFYNCHFRYPNSSEDYCNMFFKDDSLNDFVFARLMADTSEVHIESYEEYNAFMDSTYDVHIRLGDYGMPHYFSWPHMYKNMSDDDFKCTKNKVIYYNKEDATKYYAYTVMHIVRKWLDGKKKWKQFGIQEKQLIMNYRVVKTCVNDSMRLQLPDSIFDYPKAYHDVFSILDRHVSQRIQEQNDGKMRHYLIRYYGDGKLVPAEGTRSLPEEFVHDTLAIHYLDSCMNIDSRINFIQFCK